MPLEEYTEIVQNFIDKYEGRLDIDIFAEGILYTDNLPRSQKNQINRFKSIFVSNKYTSCLYDIGAEKMIDFDIKKPILYNNCDLCPRTGKDRCLTDKIKLQRK